MTMMDKIKNENAKTLNQAWRKKPRRFAPKSRLGCKTCKIRRVKCDLSRPSCLKCKSTGRTCDGYSERPLGCKAKKTELESCHYHHEKADRAKSYENHQPCTTINTYYPKQRCSNDFGLTLQNIGPLMVLPMAGSAQAQAMSFFESISIRHLNEYRPCESWRKTLFFLSQTVPSVRHAAIALALIHRNQLHHYSCDRANQPQTSRDWLPNEIPLIHYNRAIQLLLKNGSGDSTEKTAVTLLVCYLFTCYDHLAGNYVQAIKHLRAGVALARSIDKAELDNNWIYHDPEPSGFRTLISQVTRQIRRLDMQAVTFLVDWRPVDIQETFIPQLLPSDSASRSLDQAADHLQILVAQAMRLRWNAEQQLPPMGEMPPSFSSLENLVLGQLQKWLSFFDNVLQQGSTDSETYPLVSLLRLQHNVACILLGSCGPGREMDYDQFLPQFRQCLALASDFAAAHERYSGPFNPTFTPEIGIVPILYIIGVKCRHLMVRREVLNILRRQPMREAVWDSISAARLVEWVIDIENVGSGEIRHSMEQIPSWQRIEALSWVHVGSGQSAARLDITYTFCMREGIHTESLMI